MFVINLMQSSASFRQYKTHFQSIIGPLMQTTGKVIGGNAIIDQEDCMLQSMSFKRVIQHLYETFKVKKV